MVRRLTVVSPALLVLFAATALASLPAYPLLVSADGLRVYGPPARANVPCPQLLVLPQHALRTTRRAIAIAMPPFEARLKLNGRDPIVSVAPAGRSGFAPNAGGCGQSRWRRSIVAFVRLPHVRSASLSQHTFAVGCTRAGWVLWAMIH